MKLKRFTAIVISLAMVLSFVPAFSLTASAADMTDESLLDYAKQQSTLFDATNPAPTDTKDTDVATAYPDSKITSTINTGHLNVNAGPRFQCYIGSNTNGYQAQNTLNLPGYGEDKDWVLVSFVTEYTTAWGDVTLYDIDEKALTAFRYGKGDNNSFNMSWGHNGWGSNNYFSGRNYTLSTTSSTTVSSGTTQVDVLLRNYDTYYTASIFVGGNLYATGTYNDGKFNGLGKIGLARHSGDSWQRISMQNLKIYAGDVPATSVEVTATYTVNGETVKTVTKTYDSSAATGASFDEYYYRVNGENVLYKADATTLSENTTIEMTAVENWGNLSVGDTVTVNDTPYVVKGGNIVPNGNFEHDVNGWFNRPGSEITGATVAYDEAVSGNAMTISTSGAGATNSIGTKWSVETGKTYYLSFYVGGSKPTSGNYQYNKVFYGDGSTEIVAYGADMTDGAWKKFEKVFTAAQDTILFQGSWAANIKYANVELYEIEVDDSQMKTITINATGSVNDTTTVKATNAEIVPIPHYDGHIMKSRTISGNTITLVYEETVTSTGSWYMRNNFTNDNWLSQSKYIGSHDAFADTDSVFDNEGGDLYGDSFATSSSSTVINNSRAQSADVLDQLNAGVRYFDVRLSRQKDGTFATFHGPAFENFRDVATSMSQWAKENPGEVIILDFQVVRDALYTSPLTSTSGDPYNGEKKGDDNADVYAALVQLLKDTGLTDYMTTNWDKKYGEITNNGTKTVILPFGKARAVNNQGSYFINRSALHNDVTYKESDSYSTVASYLDDTYANLSGGATICTIHAYTTPTGLSTLSGNLIKDAKTNNTKWINEANFEAWMGYDKGDVLMMNDSVSNITPYYEKLNSFNRTGSKYSYSENFEREENGVTINAPQANVPFSTKFTVEKQDSEQSFVLGGTNYTTKSAYSVKLMQFNRDSVQPTGNVKLTFPKASSDNTTVDVLICNNEVVATANVGEAISYETNTLGNFVVATMAAPGVTMTVNYVDGDDTIYSETKEFAYGTTVYDVPAEDFYVVLGGKAYILNSTEKQNHVASASDSDGAVWNVNVKVVSRYAVLEDALTDSDEESKIWGINKTNENSIFVAANSEPRKGPEYDADGVAVTDGTHTPDILGGNRNGYLQFPVVDLKDGEAAIAKFYVRNWHSYTFNHGNTSIRLSATAINDDSWTRLSDGGVYVDTKAPKFDGYTSVMFSSVATNNEGYITFDVTEMMKAAKSAGLETITMRLATAYGAAYIVEREAAVAGGAYQGKAAYIDVVDAKSVTVPASATKVTKNGTDVTAFAKANDGKITVPVAATIKIAMPEPEAGKESEKVVAYVDSNGKIYKSGESFAPEGEIEPLSFGLEMATGAQVRIGDGVDEEGKAKSGSGLRFITTVNRNGSMADLDNAEIGVIVSAEGSDNTITIHADKWQDEDKTIFTAAITNFVVSNFNRKYTATPFVKVDGQTFTGTPITRSIYQVSAGLLAGDKDGTEYEDGALEAGSMLYKVLNAYVNQTGIRLQINEGKTGLEIYDVEGMSKYSGEAFFSVEETSVQDGVYTITIKPVGANTTINSYWNEYIRINNNNSAVKNYTELKDNGDGTFTITFDYAGLMASSNN